MNSSSQQFFNSQNAVKTTMKTDYNSFEIPKKVKKAVNSDKKLAQMKRIYRTIGNASSVTGSNSSDGSEKANVNISQVTMDDGLIHIENQ